MKRQSAIKIALDAMDRERRRYIFNANLYRKGSVVSPITERHHQAAKRIEEAMKEIR